MKNNDKMKKTNNMHNTKGIKGWPESERPCELLLEKGPEAVSDEHLSTILLLALQVMYP
jgi:hypothetical protein